jgi:transposase
MDSREFKGMQIAASMPVRRNTDGWLVPSQVGRGNYTVSPVHPNLVAAGAADPFTCTCPDYELRGKPCKHIFAVEMTVRREYNSDGEMVAENVKVTYTQDWSAYNAAQCAEKDYFVPMLADLCATIPNPPQGVGRPRLPMSDMAFTAISKIYAGLSARRFDSDVRDAAAKGLTDQDPHFNSVLRYLRSPEMTPVLKGLVELSALPLVGVEEDFAVDATGFSTCRYIRWYDEKWGKERSKHEWVKLHAITGVRTNIVTAAEMTLNKGVGSSDTANFRSLLASTVPNFPIRDVSADKAYSGKDNLQAVANAGGTPLIPFKNSPAIPGIAAHQPLPWASAWTKMYHLFSYQRDTFLTRYHKRSNVETTFSMIKAKFGDSLRSKSETGQFNEVLCKVIAHNLCVLIACIHEIGLEMPQFGGQLAG